MCVGLHVERNFKNDLEHANVAIRLRKCKTPLY